MSYIDRATYLEYLGDSEDLFKIVATSFLKSYASFKNTILISLDDKETLYNEIHSLKGITLNLGMKELYFSTSDILDKIKGNDLYDITIMLEIFTNSYDELVEIIS